MKVDTGRLLTALQRNRMTLKRYREERRDAVQQYVGQHYSENGTREKVPVNLLSLYTNVVGRSLIAKNPRVMLSTFDRAQKPVVSAMQQWVNEQIETLHLANTLQRIVLDALFSIGICKVALASPADASSVAWKMQAGQPFCERVDLDDFVFDITHARDLMEVGFIGHRYRVLKEVAVAMYGKKAKGLAAATDQPYNLEGDEKINVLGRGFSTNDEEYEDHVDLWEVYLPHKRLVLTLADDDVSGARGTGNSLTDPLRQQEWLGPEAGPYHLLSLGVVPGNAMPKAPIQDLVDLHELTNVLYRKLGRQAERQKEVLAVQGGATEDGSRIMEASDGDIIRVDRPEASTPRVFGGPNQGNFLFAQHVWELFSKHAGNLEMMGGLAPQSKTLGQDKLLAENASALVADMQGRTIDFTAEVVKSLCWFWWHHPTQTMETTHQLAGGLSIPRRVTPERRRGKMPLVKVDPYSMQHATPQSRAAALNQVVQQVVIPMSGLLQQQGVVFDINAYLKKIGDYLDMPDLTEILTLREPPQQAGLSEPQAPGNPAETTRNYVRRSLGGDSEQSGNADLRNTLMRGAGQLNGAVQQAG